MEGACEACEEVSELDCCYNNDTGQEVYLCYSCIRSLSQSEIEDVANG